MAAKTKKSKWKLVDSYPLKKYACGLEAGQNVRLRKDLPIRNHKGEVTEVMPAGQLWQVLSGSIEPPIVVWFRRPDGKRHTWTDSAEIYEYFEVVQGNVAI